MGGSTTYDYYSVTLSGSTITSIGGSPVDTGVPISDGPGGGDSGILGDVPNDPFQVNAVPGMTFVEVVSFSGGDGFIATDGVNDFLFILNGNTPPESGATVVITTPPGVAGSGEWDIGAGDVGCFYAGTLIATPDGERAVETLVRGDLVITADGVAMPVRWLGHSTVSTRFADPVRVLPVRIKAGALAENVPLRDLLVSPGHAVLVDDLLAHAGTLVNGRSIVREDEVPAVFTYYHVELAGHEVLLADGARVESFLDGADSMDFQNWSDRSPDAPKIEEMGYPRVKSRRQLPQVTRARLERRAAMIAPVMGVAA